MAEVAYGLCQCGCGEPAPIAKRTKTGVGMVKGQPQKYILGHNAALKVRWIEQDCGFDTPCWIWQGFLTPAGYGKPRKDQFAHIMEWEKANGPVPDGLELDHLCRNPPCCNPAHLEAVTHAENMRRSPKCTMTPESVGEVRRLLEAGLAGREIGRRLGIHERIVSSIKCGKAWVGVG